LVAQGELDDGAAPLRAARDLDVPETSHLAAVRLGLVLVRAGDEGGAATAFEDAAARCRARLARCARLFGARYALGTALVGTAVAAGAWADEGRRSGLLAPAAAEYRLALGSCAGHGIVTATLEDLDQLRAAGVEGLDPVVAPFRAALSSAPAP
jgi:hypothetical protein